MSKLLSSVLDKVSENNNEYRVELKSLNKKIDEKTTALVGDVVTISNYTVDFSNAVVAAKEMLVNKISRTVESYVIKDLRSVEGVNEQFVDKINDKLENANIKDNNEKQEFINNLNSLLNEKYLEIVKIKRVDFFDLDNNNQEIQNAISDFNNYLSQTPNIDLEKISQVLMNYKNDVYSFIKETLDQISKLYLNNFVNEIESSISSALDYDFEEEKQEEFTPFIPEIPPIPEVIIPSDISEPEIINETEQENIINVEPELNVEQQYNYEMPVTQNIEVPKVPEVEITKQSVNPVTPMEIPRVTPIEPIHVYEKPKEEVKRTYDVEEILKIAKSPIVTMPSAKEVKEETNYLNVNIFEKEKEEVNTNDFDEKEIVEEMIRRLSLRLKLINERQKAYDEKKAKIEEDEVFVNNLIENSNNKKIQLDKFEEDLDVKEREIAEKQVELNKKLNDVLPFANAIMKEEA